MTTDKEASKDDFGSVELTGLANLTVAETRKRAQEKWDREAAREKAHKTVVAWLCLNDPTAPVKRALELLDASAYLEPTDWSQLSEAGKVERHKRQRELSKARRKAEVTVGTWIYLSKPPEPVYEALGILGMPRYPDGRVTQYDPNESMEAATSGGP